MSKKVAALLLVSSIGCGLGTGSGDLPIAPTKGSTSSAPETPAPTTAADKTTGGIDIAPQAAPGGAGTPSGRD